MLRSAVVLLLLACPVAAADPDALVADVVAKRKAEADAKKARLEAEDVLKAYYADLTRKLQDLSLVGPGPVNPPTPTDPLVAKLKAAYQADTSAGKADALADLIELMRQAHELAGDPAVAKVSD